MMKGWLVSQDTLLIGYSINVRINQLKIIKFLIHTRFILNHTKSCML